MRKTDVLNAGLPANVDMEQLVLGWILNVGNVGLASCVGVVGPDDFSLTKHTLIFQRLLDLDARGTAIDRVTLANELISHGELDSVDGLDYLVSLDNGTPRLPSIDDYLLTVKEKALLRSIIFACRNLQDRCLSGDGASREILNHGEALLSRLAQTESVGEWQNPGAVIESYPGGLDALISPCRGGSGIELPWRPLQEQTCGLQNGDLVILGARPSHGKTAIALQIAECAASGGAGVAYFSLEMNKPALLHRLICSGARVNSHHARLGCLNREQRRSLRTAGARVSDLPIWIHDDGGYTTAAIRQSLKRLRATRPIGLVIVDHFHLIAGNGRDEERQRYNRIADDLQRQAKEFNVPMLVLAQLSRKCEDERRAPSLSDLKETAKLEENADLVVFAYRPECYGCNRDRPELHGLAELIIAKQRNGPTGKIEMVFIHEWATFQVAADDCDAGAAA